ncbi:MAG: hypothetical protein HYZ53_06995 [Planctomycetes bacterium]|nr:hypothetical protein [Planctomycetota bacterium]
MPYIRPRLPLRILLAIAVSAHALPAAAQDRAGLYAVAGDEPGKGQ